LCCLEGYSIFAAFYMSPITITTVGYQEIHPLRQAGRVFNSFLIFFGVAAIFVAAGAMTGVLGANGRTPGEAGSDRGMFDGVRLGSCRHFEVSRAGCGGGSRPVLRNR